MTYTCPGLSMAEREDLVACYRAGHVCPLTETTVEVTDTHRILTRRCPCCGDFRGQVAFPHGWGERS